MQGSESSSTSPRLALAGAILGALAALAHQLAPAQHPADVLQWWTAARALVHGQDPYAAVVALHLPWPLYYPLTAILPVMPLAGIPVALAHVVWSAFGGAMLGLAARGRSGLAPALLSGSFFAAAFEGQWSPLLVAACVLPNLAFAWAAKPTVGLACLSGWPSGRAVWVMACATTASLFLFPAWPLLWWETIRGGTLSVLPLIRPGGFLLLLGFLRWRTPEGRLLGALALVPQTTVLYEALPVFLCARTRWEGYGLAVCSWVVGAIQQVQLGTDHTVTEQAVRGWPWLLVGLYLPALALVLRPSPAALAPATSGGRR